MSKFVLLLRGEGRWAEMSPSEIEAAMRHYGQWMRDLRAQGRIAEGEELAPEGKVIGRDGGITDGPFAEGKEGVGGFFIIEAASLDEATQMSRDCPHLSYGGFVEIRPTVDHSQDMADSNSAAVGATS